MDADHRPSLPGPLQQHLINNPREISSIEGRLSELGLTSGTVLVTSCFEQEGKTTAAVSLAWSLVQLKNARVLLIDASPSPTGIGKLFDVAEREGLTNWDSRPEAAPLPVVETAHNGLFLLPLGSPDAQAKSPWTRERFEGMLAHFKAQFDIVVVDGPSVLGASDISRIAGGFDALFLTVECEKTKWEVVQMVTARLRKAGAAVSGVILNKRKHYIPGIFYGKV